jgi:hypothetical protein
MGQACIVALCRFEPLRAGASRHRVALGRRFERAGETRDETRDSHLFPHIAVARWRCPRPARMGRGEKGGIRCSFLLNLLRNPTREFVIPGGGPIPEGSMLFKLGENGAWLPIQKR